MGEERAEGDCMMMMMIRVMRLMVEDTRDHRKQLRVLSLLRSRL